MNDKSNTQIIKEFYGKIESGDITGLLELFSEDIHLKIPKVNGSPLPAELRGREKVHEFFGMLGKTYEFSVFERREFIAGGDKVAVLGHSVGKNLLTGRNFETEWVNVFTLKDGKIIRWLDFFDTAEMSHSFQKNSNV